MLEWMEKNAARSLVTTLDAGQIRQARCLAASASLNVARLALTILNNEGGEEAECEEIREVLRERVKSQSVYVGMGQFLWDRLGIVKSSSRAVIIMRVACALARRLGAEVKGDRFPRDVLERALVLSGEAEGVRRG